jgi:hypothetical protein
VTERDPGVTIGPPSSLLATSDADVAIARAEHRHHGHDPMPTVPRPPAGRAQPDEALVERLRAGDEAAFVARRAPRPATPAPGPLHVSDAVADDVVQETWIAVLRGLEQFEGRSALQTWMIRILLNIARSRGVREHRQVPLSAFDAPDAWDGAVDRDRFRSAGDRFPGGWVSFRAMGRTARAAVPVVGGVEVALRTIASLP